MTVEEYREQYKGMSAAQVRGLISSSYDFRRVTEELYTSAFHKRLNKNCGDCWMDAYIIIMKTNPEKMKAMVEKQFDLRAGAVLIDPQGDATKTATHHNLTDELALYHLRTHPNCAKFFSLLPPNWEDMALASGVGSEVYTKEPAESDSKPQDAPKAEKVNNGKAAPKKAATGQKKTTKK